MDNLNHLHGKIILILYNFLEPAETAEDDRNTAARAIEAVDSSSCSPREFVACDTFLEAPEEGKY